MLTTLIIVGVLVLAWPLAGNISRPASTKSSDRDGERRARYVARNPHEVNTGDIHRMLLDGDLEQEEADFVCARATGLGVKPFTMLVWLRRFDAPALATVIAADLGQNELIAHISNGTLPDLEGLAVFAELNGFATVARSGRNVRRAEAKLAREVPEPRVVTAEQDMPVISDPVAWAMQDGAPVILETLGFPGLSGNGEGERGAA